MAWNRPRGSQQTETALRRGKTSLPAVRGAIAGAIVVLGAAVAAWWLWPEGETRQDAASTKKGLIKEVEASAPAKAEPVKEDVVEYKHVKNGKYMKYVNGEPVWSYPKYKDYGPSHTVKVTRVKSFIEKTFHNYADRQIASLITHRPGDKIVGSPRYENGFKEQFLKSLTEPELPTADDTPEQRQLKRDVAAVKADLKARLDAGEDIAAIMSDTRQKLRELSVYKRELEAEVSKHAHADEVSAEDLADFVAAANRMLEARGIEPFKADGFLRNQTMYRKMQQQRKEQAE